MKHFLFATMAVVLLLAPLAAASITVSSPNGTPWCINSPYTITWTSMGVSGNVDIILRPANAPTAPPTLGIAAGTANDGSEGWTISASLAPGNYLVRIRSVSDPTVYGDSAAFAINNCLGGAIQVSQPAGDPWCLNSLYTITWTSAGVTGNVDIILRPANAPTAPPALGIAAGTANDGSEGWTIPASLAPGNYLVRIRSVNNPAVYGDSANFEIKSCGNNVIPKQKGSAQNLRDHFTAQPVMRPNLILCNVAPGQLSAKHMDPNNPGFANFNFIVRILNIGKADSKPCWLKVVFGGGAGDSRVMPTIKAGESITETFIIHAQLDDSLSVSYSVWIDEQNQVNEMEESDNYLAGVISATTVEYAQCSDGKDHFPTN